MRRRRGIARSRRPRIESRPAERRVSKRPQDESGQLGSSYYLDPPATQAPDRRRRSTAAWPGVTARCGSSKRTSIAWRDSNWANGRGGGGVLVANLDFGAHGLRLGAIEIQFMSCARQSWPQQVVVAADDHALRGRLGRDDVERLAGRHAQPAPLSDGEMMHAGMLAQHAAIGVDESRPASSSGAIPRSRK